MKLENLTPFSAVPFIASRTRTEFHLTLLVKGAFQVGHGQPFAPLDDPVFPTGDVPLPQPDAPSEPLEYASDLAPLKLRADVLVSATAYRPADQREGTFPIAIRVGQLTKQLVISGDRNFDQGLLGRGISPEQPLPAVPVTYANAYGGEGCAANPFGKGYRNDQVPNIEYPDQRMKIPGDRPQPAGFGPIPTVEPRCLKIGSYGGDYLEQHWPAFPPDFDWTFFNAAPEDQQVEGFLRGDEPFVAQSLHAEHALYQSQLPGLRIVCVREDADGSLSLVPMQLDTLQVDMESEQAVLLWRAMIPVASPDVKEIGQLGLLVQELTEPLSSAEEYQRSLAHLIQERDGEFEPQEEAEEETPDTTSAAGTEASAAAAEEDARERAAFDAEVEAFKASLGIQTPDTPSPKEPPPLDEIDMPADVREKVMAAFAETEKQDQEFEAEQEARKWTREKVLAAVAAGETFAAVDLSGLDLSDCDLAGANFSLAVLRKVRFDRARLAQATFTGGDLDQAVFDGADLAAAQLDQAVLTRTTFTAATLTAANLAGSDLTEANLEEADLREVHAEQAVFTQAKFAGARLVAANLTGSNLERASLAGCDLSDAVLADASLVATEMTAAVLSGANLTGARFESARMPKAVFEKAIAKDTDFTEAVLAEAAFQAADCEGAWFSSAQLDRADFHRANLTDVQFDGTSARQTNFADTTIAGLRGGEDADLSGAVFPDAVRDEPLFEDCTVDGCDFTNAEIPGGNFIHASAVGTNFQSANIKAARFDSANCHQACYDNANLFEACFAGADLGEASFRAANLYGSELLDAHISGIRLEDANLNMTKLAR